MFWSASFLSFECVSCKFFCYFISYKTTRAFFGLNGLKDPTTHACPGLNGDSQVERDRTGTCMQLFNGRLNEAPNCVGIDSCALLLNAAVETDTKLLDIFNSRLLTPHRLNLTPKLGTRCITSSQKTFVMETLVYIYVYDKHKRTLEEEVILSCKEVWSLHMDADV
jgi:hypothetical protein